LIFASNPSSEAGVTLIPGIDFSRSPGFFIFVSLLVLTEQICIILNGKNKIKDILLYKIVSLIPKILSE
jgi:hypothetical protein